MDAQPQLGFWAPRPSYFISLSGTLDYTGAPVTIQATHKRQGDLDSNPIVRVLFTNPSTAPGPLFSVFDETNAECAIIPQYTIAGIPIEILTDTKLKIQTSAYSTSNLCLYLAMVYYLKPPGR